MPDADPTTAGTEVLEFGVPATRAGLAMAMDGAEAFLARQSVSGDALARVLLVLEEALMNVSMHGGDADPGHVCRVELKLQRDEQGIHLHLRDDGRAFDPTQAAPPAQPASLAEARVGGWGVALMRRFARQMHYRREGGRNCLHLLLDAR